MNDRADCCRLQDLCKYLGIEILHEELMDPELHPKLHGLFPSDTTKNVRLAIKFYVNIELGGLTYLIDVLILVLQERIA